MLLKLKCLMSKVYTLLFFFSDDVQEATEKFCNWLFIQYKEAHKLLVLCLGNQNSAVQEISLLSIVKLIQAEGRNPIKKVENTYPFPQHRLQNTLQVLISDKENQQHLISRLQEYMEYQDFLFYTIKCLSTIVKQHKGQEVTEVYLNNLFMLLEQIEIPNKGIFPTYQTLLEDNMIESAAVDEMGGIEEESVKSDGQSFTFKYQECQKCINEIWMEVIKYQLTAGLYRRALVLIPEKVIQHLKQPVKLADFFIEAYNLGGAFSLMALQGVFILINKHNLDYPNFYTKLYSLLEPNIFHAKYKPRFFMLLNLFLSSTHLPEYLIAAFIKKMSRLSLVAPTHSLVLIIKFIANLLVRFPSLRKLTNNPDVSGVDSDPFVMDEKEPSSSKASESSLWEIATLKHHVIPFISKAAQFVDRNPPDIEYDLSDIVETTYEDVFEKATKIKMKEVPTTFHKPESLFHYHNDQMSGSWFLCN